MPTDYLNFVITIAIGLAGLASLLTLFKSSENFTEGDYIDFQDIFLSCVLICMGALLPELLNHIVEDILVWRISTVFFSVMVAILQLRLLLAILQKKYEAFWIAYPLQLFTLLINVFVLIATIVDPRDIWFLGGLYWVLLLTSLRLFLFLVSVTNTQQTVS